MGVTILVFGLMSLLSPAARVSLYVRDIPKREGEIGRLITKYGLDDPIHEQYFRWLGQVLRGDLGFSQTGKEPVADSIRRLLPATVELAVWSIIPYLWVGIQLGVFSATQHNRWPDQLLRITTILGYSIPLFVFGLFALMIFYGRLDWFQPDRLSPDIQRIVENPALFRRVTHLNTVDAILNLRLDVFVDALRHLMLPVMTLSYLGWAGILRVTRSSMLETLRQDYVRTAYAKGLSARTVIQKHARPNAMIPVATVGGLTIIGLLNGVVITETIFNYPGMGQYFVRAALQLDYIAVLGFMLFNSSLLVVGNLVVDVLYAYLDPRVRLG
jgi:peptide/nickel transport system permease protein